MQTWKKTALVPAALCGAGVIFVAASLGVTHMKVGSVESVGSGWFTMLWTLIGGGAAFSFPALLNVVMNLIAKFRGTATPDVAGIGAGSITVPEIVELVTSFNGVISNPKSRPAQRRFVFALVDASDFIPGLTTTHEGGVIILKYEGFADPPAPAVVTQSVATGFMKTGA
jgi:hypothetical protein